MSRFPRTLALALTVLFAGAAEPSSAARRDRQEPEASSWERAVAGLEKREGLLDVYLDRDGHRVLLGVPPAGADGVAATVLYIEGLVTGLGSNPVGLDRGQLGGERILDLRRLGRRVLFEEPNLRFRALSDDPAEVAATRESFATSVLWAGDAEAVADDGRALLDVTGFLLRDEHDVVATLKATGQGAFSLDASRSAVDFDACLAFPDNLVFEALLTYAGDEPGEHVRSTAPTAEAITLRQMHGFVRLPEPGYVPRRVDPRMASFGIVFSDYAAPLDAPIEQRWIVRHRLQRSDPSSETSPAVEPLVYYVDPGIPEPVRSAVVEGASWWAQAFAAAGFEDAFRVAVLPEGAHPLDVRYNVIEWVHRSTRGWSYGGGVVDPRTGEMIKGHVSLGSLRVRQDRLLFEGLSDVSGTGSGEADDPVQLALARIRQLSAHEVGHTLGFTHNFAASTYAGRASVMDYPAPLVRLREDGSLDFSSAYGVGMGAWDLHAANWAYREFPPGADEAAELDAIVREGQAKGYLFIADADARPAGAAHPLANLWDNGSDPIAQLRHDMAVRARALADFGEANIRSGQPLALLEEVLAPLYFHHRYQVDAVAKSLGGVEYGYAVRGGDGFPVTPVAPERQRDALAALLDTLSPEALDLPGTVLSVLHPRPFMYGGNRELFVGGTGPVFDPLAAAVSAADLTVSNVLVPERLNRLHDQHRRRPAQPGVSEVLSALVDAVMANASPASERQAAIGRATAGLVVRRLGEASRDERLSTGAAAAAEKALADLAEGLESVAWGAEGDPERVHLARLARRLLDRDLPPQPAGKAAEPLPPGSPIGSPDLAGCSWEGGLPGGPR